MSSVKAAAYKCSEIEEEEEEEEEESRDLFEIDTNYGIIIGRGGRSLLTPVKEDDQDCKYKKSYDDESTHHHESSSSASDLFSFEVGPNGENHVVYVAVWRPTTTAADQSSVDALLWTLNNLIIVPPPPLHPPPANVRAGDHHPSSSSATTTTTTTTAVYLIHVFPELRHIPTPLGKLPLSQANPEQKESFMIQERIKRRDFLQKFLDLCSASKVRVETILIESDMEAKAILDLIPILNITKLVLGTSKSSLRKMRSKRGSGTVDQILQKAPDFCEVKVICQGKEVFEDQLIVDSPTPSPRSSPRPSPPPPLQDHITDAFTCGCFKPKAVS